MISARKNMTPSICSLSLRPEKGKRKYSASKNLKKPKPHVSDCKMTNRKVRKCALNFHIVGREIMEKTYPGYVVDDYYVLFSDVLDGVYIRCVMRKKEDRHEQKAKNQTGQAGAKAV